MEAREKELCHRRGRSPQSRKPKGNVIKQHEMDLSTASLHEFVLCLTSFRGVSLRLSALFVLLVAGKRKMDNTNSKFQAIEDEHDIPKDQATCFASLTPDHMTRPMHLHCLYVPACKRQGPGLGRRGEKRRAAIPQSTQRHSCVRPSRNANALNKVCSCTYTAHLH